MLLARPNGMAGRAMTREGITPTTTVTARHEAVLRDECPCYLEIASFLAMTREKTMTGEKAQPSRH